MSCFPSDWCAQKDRCACVECERVWGDRIYYQCLLLLSVSLCLRQDLSVNPELTDVTSELAGSACLHSGVRWTLPCLAVLCDVWSLNSSCPALCSKCFPH